MFDVFSRDPDVNGTSGMPGMGYYRPFSYLNALILVKLFGPQSGILMTLAGSAMSLSLLIYFLIVHRGYSLFVALLSLVSLLLLYSNLLYQAFRLMVPFGYLREIVALIAAIIALKRNKLRSKKVIYIIVAIMLYIISTSRQSSIVLVPVITVLWCLFIEYRSVRSLDRLRDWIISLYMLIAFLLLLSFELHSNGFMYQWGGIDEFIERVFQRFNYYWNFATAGFRLTIVLISTAYIAVRGLLSRYKRSSQSRIVSHAGIVLTLVVTVFGLLVTTASQWSFLILSIFAIWSIPKIIIGYGWFWTGITIYLVPTYYHQAYMLEAIMGLCIVLAICFGKIVSDIQKSIKYICSKYIKCNKKYIIYLVLISAAGIISFCIPRILPAVQSKVLQIQAFINTNRSTSSMVNYVTEHLHSESIILVFSHSQLGTSAESWREQSLLYRATEVRVLDLKDFQSMVWGLGSEVFICEYRLPSRKDIERATYAVAYSTNEADVIKNDWLTDEVADFSVGSSYCVLLELKPRRYINN